MPSFKPAIVLVALALAGCSQTQSLDDAATGLKVTVDGDYLVEAWDLQQPYTAMIAVSGRNGHPFVPGETAPICIVAFQPLPDNAGTTQAQINANVPQWGKAVEAELAPALRFEAQETFEQNGLIGYQMITSPKGATSAKMRIVLSVLETPKGRTVVNCSGDAQTLTQAMPTYNLIRAGVTAP